MAPITITLKALVDKVKSKIIYVESKGDFVDVLCSCLTMPLGEIIRLTHNHPPIIDVGCISNLYASVENLDASVSEVAHFIISDDLEVQPTSSVFLVSLLAKHGVQDFSSLEERTFQIGADEVLNLLKSFWVSRTPLTDALLQKSTTREVMDLDRRVRRGLEPFAQGEEHLSLQRLTALEERLTNLHLRLEALVEDVDDTLALVKQETIKKGKEVVDRNESGSKSKKIIVVGPCGGNGGESWDDGIYSGVREITLVYCGCIDSFTVVYDKNGEPAPPVKHGGAGGTKTAVVKLQYPEEYLTSVTGHYCPFSLFGSPVIRSLMFKSNKRTFGPFGVEEGTLFTLTVEGGSVVGFKGRSGWYIDAIGFHLSS